MTAVLAVGVTVDAIPCVAISSVAVRSVRAIPVVERPIIGTAIITKSEAACAPLVAFARSPRLAASLADDENHEQSPAPVLSCDIDLLHPTAEYEKRSHKLKRLVESPNSYFMDVKCQGCFSITTVFSHSQTVVVCPSCNAVLCVPTGGKARLSEGCSFRRKTD